MEKETIKNSYDFISDTKYNMLFSLLKDLKEELTTEMNIPKLQKSLIQSEMELRLIVNLIQSKKHFQQFTEQIG